MPEHHHDDGFIDGPTPGHVNRVPFAPSADLAVSGSQDASALPAAPPGWYDDGSGQRRWWNGTTWTDQYEARPRPGWYPFDPQRQRYWDGQAWADSYAPLAPQQTAVIAIQSRPGNGPAIASLVLGIIGFLLTPIPLGIGLIFGGIPDTLAIILGITGLVTRPKYMGAGTGPAVAGLILGGLAFLTIFLGAGTIW